MRNNNKCADKSRESLWIASPVEEEKIRRSRECTQSRLEPTKKKVPSFLFFCLVLLRKWRQKKKRAFCFPA